MDYYKNNDLGGKEYSEKEQQIIMQLATFMKNRDSNHHHPDKNPSMELRDPRRVRPKDYMFLYVKAAGAVFETAKYLMIGEAQDKRLSQMDLSQWIHTITGITISQELANEIKSLPDVDTKGDNTE